MPTVLLRLAETLRRTGLSRSSMYELIATNDFPSPVRINRRTVGWPEHEIEQWIADRISASRDKEM